MHARRHHAFTVEDYLEYELGSGLKFEYVDGAILAMAGGSPRHNTIVLKASGALDRRVGNTCRAFGSDQRIATADGVYTYPDAMVVCGPLELTRFQGTATIHNPSLVLEVLSPSTREYDLGEKVAHYKSIPTLVDILLIEPDEVNVLHLVRTEDAWTEARYLSVADTVRLRCLRRRLPVAEIYARAFEV